MELSEIGEFGVIDFIREQFRNLIPEGWEGIGDDCAIIPWDRDRSLVVTTDMLLENVHFLPDRITPYQLGYKSLAVNLSDIAAMGAKPVATFLSLGVSAQTDKEWVGEFLKGYREFSVPLLGGDTVTSKGGLTISVTALGMVPNGQIKRRRDARPGDLIAVTGALGDSAAGLRALLENTRRTPDIDTLILRHHTPEPHLKEGEWLAGHKEVHAMMDVSDGVASDLRHILKASGVSGKLDRNRIPISDTMRRVAGQFDWNPQELALAGGEDYVLLFTVDPSQVEKLAADYRNIFGKDFHIIGEITEGEAGEIDWQGECFEGYKHF